MIVWLIPAHLLQGRVVPRGEGGGPLLTGRRKEVVPLGAQQGQRLWGPHSSPNSLTEDRVGLLSGA